jgi:hypothetical protein
VKEHGDIRALILFHLSLTLKATLISSLRDEEGEVDAVGQSATGELNQAPLGMQQVIGGNEAESKARTPTS